MKNFMMITIISIIAGCAVYEPLPGLCYTDKTGTYLCPTDPTNEPPIARKPKCIDYGMIEYCEGLTQNDMECQCVHHNDMTNVTDFLWR